MRRVLIGGGWNESAANDCYGPFLAVAAKPATPTPTIGCVVVDEGDGQKQYERFATILTSVAPCLPIPLLMSLDASFAPTLLDGLDGLLVCSGQTPAYAAALSPASAAFRAWMLTGRPYAGFSPGAAVAAGEAIVGGYRIAGRVVCPPDGAEDLDNVTIVNGLGLVPFAADVHAAQWGTLGRLCGAVTGASLRAGIAIDEDTALVVDDNTTS